MSKRLIGALLGALSVAVVAMASNSGESTQTPQNPYAAVYVKNLAGMKLPDQALDLVLPPDADLKVSEFTATTQASRTCSQRCSTTCTTTRGCKQQTDGCQGTATQPKPSQPATPSTPIASSVRLTLDVTERTLVNSQRALAIAGYEGFCLDGADSPTFRTALRDFQTRQSLPADGVLGDTTWQALRALLVRATSR